MEDILKWLNQVRLFASLSPLNKRRVAELIQRTSPISPGTTIVRQGDLGTTFFIVDSGRVVATALDARGDPTPPRYLEPGDAWGETSLLIGEPRDATMQTVERTELFYLKRPAFMQLLDEYPEIYEELTIREDVYIKLTAPQFFWLNKGEKVAWYGRKHWIVFARSLVAMLVVWAIMAGILFFIGQMLLSWQLWIILVSSLILIVPWIAWAYVDWRNDFHVITNRRVIHIEKILLRYQSRTEAPLDKVQNVHREQGFWGNAFGYADVYIMTAGAQIGRVPFLWVEDPQLVNRVLTEQVRRFVLWRRSRDYERIHEILEERLEEAEQAEPMVPDLEEQEPVGEPERPDPLSLLSRTEGCSRIYRDTAVYSFLLEPHFPRLWAIHENGSIIWRKHWLLLVAAVTLPLLAFFVLLGVTIYGLWQPFGSLPRVVLAPILLGGLALVFFWLAYQYEDWRNDLYVVTRNDIIDIERTPFLARESRRQASLDRIQNIYSEIPGFWSSLFKMGDVVIETAGQGPFTFSNVYNPAAVQGEISSRIDAMQERKEEAERRRREAELADWFDVYHEEFEGERSSSDAAGSRPSLQ